MAVLRAVSFNLWKNDGRFAERMQRMTAGLAAIDADVMALQECFFAATADIDVADQIARHTNLRLVRGEQRHKPRVHDHRPVDSRSDLALLSKAPLASVACMALPDDPRDGERRLLIASMVWEGRRLRVGCTHFTHLGDGQALRRGQAEAAVAALLDDPACTTLLMGDFNASATAPELASLFEHPRLPPDCAAQAHAAAGKGRTGGAIDHALLFPALSERWRYDRRLALPPDPNDPQAGPSDHPAINCDLERLS